MSAIRLNPMASQKMPSPGSVDTWGATRIVVRPSPIILPQSAVVPCTPSPIKLKPAPNTTIKPAKDAA